MFSSLGNITIDFTCILVSSSKGGYASIKMNIGGVSKGVTTKKEQHQLEENINVAGSPGEPTQM